ncbi:unnamed protein product [Rotaria socialis]|uniref:Bulb-type lectin domain-containing protein n=1 Tax=Rotaria socialis TaxID=392032 RepID=A0A820VED3_9BILA|nr:unnamed protein product [Rotaria socialis]
MHRNKFNDKPQLAVTNQAWKPIAIGIIVGGLLAGVAFASMLSLYLTEQTEESALSTTTSTTLTATTASTTTVLTTSTTTTSTTSTTTASTTSTTTTSTTSTTSTTTTSTTSTTSTTTTTSTTSTTSTTTTSTTSTTTTTAPVSSICVTNTSANLYNNQFVYSPTSQIYATGLLNNQFGVYIAYGYANVTSTALWTAAQSSISQAYTLALQADRNLVVYSSTSGALWNTATNNGGIGSPFCFQMLDSGNLIWTDGTNTIIWQTNTVQTG